MALLEADTAHERAFPRWAMAEVAADSPAVTYLIAHEDGISPAAGRGVTPEQDMVLGAMRAAAEQGAYASGV